MFIFLCLAILHGIISSFIHLPANPIISVFSTTEEIIIYMFHVFIIYSSFDEHVGDFHFLVYCE